MRRSTVSDISFEIGVATDEGRAGKNNEDAYTTFQVWLQGENESTRTQPVQVAVVADGVGGAAAGERASNLAVEVIEKVMTEDSATPVGQRLEKAIKQANKMVFELTARMPMLRGMATTVVAAAIVGDHLYVAHAGDSRAYLIRNGQAHLLTKDHTWAQEAVDAGYLTPEEAAQHPNRNVIKRFLGVTDQVEVDHQLMGVLPDSGHNSVTSQPQVVDRLRLKPGDTILLCSDGLTDVVQDQKIQNVVTRSRPQKAAQKLIDMANAAGGPDNITAILVHWPDGKRRSKGAYILLPLLTVAGVALLLLLVKSLYPDLMGASTLESLGVSLRDTLQARIAPTAAGTPTVIATPNTNQAAVDVLAKANPSATPLATRTNPTATSTNTLVPTSTGQKTDQEPVPTSTLIVPTETPTPSPTVAIPTLEPTSSLTPTETVEATSNTPPIELLAPSDGSILEEGSSEVTFEWQYGSDCNLLEANGFELRVWVEGLDAQAAMDAVADQSKVECQGGIYSFKVGDLQGAPGVLGRTSGELNWDVILVRIAPDYVPEPLARSAPAVFKLGSPGVGN